VNRTRNKDGDNLLDKRIKDRLTSTTSTEQVVNEKYTMLSLRSASPHSTSDVTTAIKQAELVDRRSSELVVKSQYKMSSSDDDGRRRLIQICLIVFVVVNSHLSVAGTFKYSVLADKDPTSPSTFRTLINVFDRSDFRIFFSQQILSTKNCCGTVCQNSEYFAVTGASDRWTVGGKTKKGTARFQKHLRH